MILIALICHLNGPCDRIKIPVGDCNRSMVLAQQYIAQARVAHPDDRVTVKCVKNG